MSRSPCEETVSVAHFQNHLPAIRWALLHYVLRCPRQRGDIGHHPLLVCQLILRTAVQLAYLEAIHFFVELLDQYFGNVCELDLVFNFHKASSEITAAASELCTGTGSGG